MQYYLANAAIVPPAFHCQSIGRVECDTADCGDVAEHIDLYHLGLSDRSSQLDSTLGIVQGDIVGRDGVAERRLGYRIASTHQNSRAVLERIAVLQTRFFGNSTIGERDVSILDHTQRNLALDLGRLAAGIVLLDDECLDLLVGNIARVNDDIVAPHGVTRLTLAAIDTHSLPSRLAVASNATESDP